jgi:hypothetical protein
VEAFQFVPRHVSATTKWWLTSGMETIATNHGVRHLFLSLTTAAVW